MILYNLAENCDYGDIKEEMIRDRLVVGIRDTALSAKMQMDSTLTLETVKKSIRHREAVHEQQQALKGASERAPSNRETIRPQPNSTDRRNRREQRSSRDFGIYRSTPATKGREKQCSRCGRGQHPRDNCPAKEAKCHKCQRKGHYSSQCYSKTVSTLEDDRTLDTAFLDTVSSRQDNAWYTTASINGKEISFKLDTGAEVTAISKETWEVLGKPALQEPDRLLFCPARQPFDLLGHFQGHLSHRERSTTHQVFVVNKLKNNLLGLPAITSLKLAARIEQTSSCNITSSERIKEKFPKVFQGLGNLGGEYTIKLGPDAKPYSLFTPRHVPLPLRPKVEEELNRMEKEGVISKVSEPTQWCAGMVVVLKKSGSVRICVDLKPLNTSVLREVHPLPKVDETLAQLAGAKVFTKLDANSGFWQIPLSPSSRLLTTFITPLGRYCFNKLPFGISSAPEHFQRRVSEILTGLQGTLCQMDDILVFGKDQAEHDARLVAVLTRIEEAGGTLNPQKCEFSRDNLKFLGHVIDSSGIRADPDKTAAITKISVWWPGILEHISNFVKNCHECTRDATPHKEPLISSSLPEYPWQKVGSDLFTLKGVNYLIVSDYFSRYPVVVLLKTTTSQSIITAMKSIFSRHGIPEVVISDNGPQYSSQEFADFATAYSFSHITSSPHYPQSNGHTERAVKTVKGLLKDSEDPYLSLLSYRSTPLPWCDRSPAELLMGRRIRSDLPQSTKTLVPQWPCLQEFKTRNQQFKSKQKRDYDRRHQVRELPEIPDDTEVWITTNRQPTTGRTIAPADTPRSYIVQTPSGDIRRNRSQLNIRSTSTTNDPTTRDRSPIRTRTRTGTTISPPVRLS